MQYVICYDIADDRRRNRVATALLDFGRACRRAFLWRIWTRNWRARMKERVERLVDADWDRLHVFEMCAGCAKRVWTVGSAELEREAEWYVI